MRKEDLNPFWSIPYTVFIERNESRRKRGDDLGILIYFSLWAFIILIITLFSKDPRIISMNAYYLIFDFLCIIFISFHLLRSYFKKKNNELEIEIIEFPKFDEFSSALVFVSILFIIYVFINRIISPLMFRFSIADSFIWGVFALIRVVPTEELVFRGFLMSVIVYVGTKIFNNNREKETYERNDKIIWYIAIIVIGILFGLAHYSKYYNAFTFPYFTLWINGIPYSVNIFFPLLLLSIMGIILGIIRYKYGLWACIVFHMINNFFAEAIIYTLTIYL